MLNKDFDKIIKELDTFRKNFIVESEFKMVEIKRKYAKLRQENFQFPTQNKFEHLQAINQELQ